MPFPLDRLLAIVGVLLEENDADARLPAPQYSIPGEYTDMEISRVVLHIQVYHISKFIHQCLGSHVISRSWSSPVCVYW